MQQQAKVAIPADLAFSDLRLTRHPCGAVPFNWAVIERIHSDSVRLRSPVAVISTWPIT